MWRRRSRRGITSAIAVASIVVHHVAAPRPPWQARGYTRWRDGSGADGPGADGPGDTSEAIS